MKKIKVNKASGTALNWLVAKCEGVDYMYYMDHGGDYNGWTTGPHTKNYSTNWAQGGHLIDWVDTFERVDGVTTAHKRGATGQQWEGKGPTALIAACRCRVVSKLGEEVEIPNKLLTD